MMLLQLVKLMLLLNCIFISSKIVVSNNHACDILMSVELYSTVKNINGSILLNDVLYPIDKISNNNNLIACLCSINKQCLKNCCYNGYSIGINRTYISNDHQHQISDLKYYSLNDLSEPINLEGYSDFFSIIYNKNIKDYCSNNKKELKKCYVLQNKKNLVITSDENNKTLDTTKYCLEWYEEVKALFEREGRLVERRKLTILEWILVSITLVLLAITFIIYSVLPELNNLGGKCLKGHILSTYMCYITHFIADYIYDHEVTRLIVIYSYHSNIFWNTVICYNTWNIIRATSSHILMSRREIKKKIFMYASFAWGLPLLIDGTLIITIYVLDEFNVFEEELPGDIAVIILPIGPFVIALILNTAIFIATTYNMYHHKKQRSALKATDRNFNDTLEKQWLYLHVKFFFLMGLSRNIYLLIWYVNMPKWLTTVLYSIVRSDGIAIFIIFICKIHVMKKVFNKIFPFINIGQSKHNL
ncbi:uncharacterized protein LOC142318536 [Lycorma delicatula]|uniref:uncharacterized protein LOC142318536 n=1 Tax=Lycorma delicatula TaxID=130591 RepID=UPI003F510B42